MSTRLCRWRTCFLHGPSLCLLLATLLGCFLWWYAINSDRDNIPPLLTQLIPSGHCTCTNSVNFICGTCLDRNVPPSNEKPSLSWTFDYRRDQDNLGLDQGQCMVAFPGLFEDISRAVQYWQRRKNISYSTLDDIGLPSGTARAAIAKGELYVIAVNSKGEDHRRKILAMLSSIYRALVSNKDSRSIPDMEFIFSVEDKISDIGTGDGPVWVLARTVSEEAAWLMPDFGFWAWENIHNSIGPYTQIVDRIVEYENANHTWDSKMMQLVWRGKLSFAPKLRRTLLEVSRDKPWADVKPLSWYPKSNVLTMDDHCRYMFIAHVEGRSYSGSLKYRQACRSVIISHKLQYIQHHHYLMVNKGPNQNFVEVERDFSDLPAKMEALLADPSTARLIANNSVETFRERYLTQAATACYWRELFKGYASVFSEPAMSTEGRVALAGRGMRYESFVLMSDTFQLRYGR